MDGTAAGFHFRERMAGWVSTLAIQDPSQGARQAEADRQWAEVVLDIDYPDLDAVLRSSATCASVRGTALIAGLSPIVMQVTGGHVRALRPRSVDQVQTWEMRYELKLPDPGRAGLHADGVKHLHRDSVLAAWPRTTTLSTSISDDTDGSDRRGRHPACRAGADFLRQLTTMRVTDTMSIRARAWPARCASSPCSSPCCCASSAGCSASPGRSRPSRRCPRHAAAHARRPRRAWCTGDAAHPEWQDRECTGCLAPADPVPGRLQGTGAARAGLRDVDRALRHGHHRAEPHGVPRSPRLRRLAVRLPGEPVSAAHRAGSSRSTTSRAMTGRRRGGGGLRVHGSPTVQVFAHCVGSMSFQMAMLWDGNAQMRSQVRSAVCSQVTVHPVSSWFNTFKVKIGLGPILEKMAPVMVPDENRTLGNVVYDLILRIAPTPRGEGCGNAVCQWITAYFGLTHRHAQLNDDTHNDLGRLFGVTSVHALRHIGNMVAARQVTRSRRQGRLPEVRRAGRAGQRAPSLHPDPVPRRAPQQDLLPGHVEANLATGCRPATRGSTTSDGC